MFNGTVCREAIEQVNRLACPSCEVTVLDTRELSVADRAGALGIRAVPAVVRGRESGGLLCGRGTDGVRASRGRRGTAHLVEILSRTTGHKVAFEPTPIEEVQKFSEDFAIMVEWFDRVGYDVDIPGLAKESGVRPTRFAEWAAEQDWA